MSNFKKLTFIILLFFISTLSLNTIVLGSSAKYVCEDDGASDPIYVKTINITGAGEKTIQQWIRLIMEKENIDEDNESKAKGVLGEITAMVLFQTQGYEIIENEAHRVIGCTITTKASAKGEGIDGIFLHDKYWPIFNEAKFRKNGCKASDLPCTSYGQEASIEWYSYHFSHLRDNSMTKSPQCSHIKFGVLEENFREGNILRTMTCLNKKGEIELYYIKDKKETNNKNVKNFLGSFPDLDSSELFEFFSKFYK